MRLRAAFIGSLALVVPSVTGIYAAGTNSSPRVDTSGVNLQPAYPQTASQNMERGATVLGVAVTTEGLVAKVALIETSGFNDLDASAISTVLGWKFLPAMKDGSPVEGTTMVKLVFEPPAAPANASSIQQTPASSKELFPGKITISVPDGKLDTQSFAVPCRRGAFEGVVTVEQDAKRGGQAAFFAVNLSTGPDTAQFSIYHVGARLVTAQLVHVANDHVQGGSNYWGSGEMGVAIPISIRWGGGLVIGNGGKVFGQHQVGFGEGPEKLDIAVSSGDVTISNPRLVCLPNSS